MSRTYTVILAVGIIAIVLGALLILDSLQQANAKEMLLGVPIFLLGSLFTLSSIGGI